VVSSIKNERIAFAATENAKVWTSVRRTYFNVEYTKPERQDEPLTDTLGTTVSSRHWGGNGWPSFNIYPVLSESCGALFGPAPLTLECADLSVRVRKNHGSHLLISLHFALL
jgi:hypothetical protein